MRSAPFVLGLWALVATSASGMVSESDSTRPSRRDLVVENSWMAVVKGDESRCDEVRVEIEALRKALASPSIRAIDENPTMKANIQRSCFLNFVGPKSLADAVEKIEDIEYVEPNKYLSVAATNDPVSWGLNRIDQDGLPLSSGVPFTTSHYGSGVNIYIIDTGINAEHSEFNGRAVIGKVFVLESSNSDMNGHGTHCAGTAAGVQTGIARQATVIGVKVLDMDGSGSYSAVISGIEWAVKQQQTNHGGQTAVLSLSLGGGISQSIDDAILAAGAAGMIVTVAAGNDNSDACLFSPSGKGGNAAETGVFSVGATDSKDYRSTFSNYGACVDMFAPGTGIYSAWIGGPQEYVTISGTSMATPHVAGVAATLIEKHSFDQAAVKSELLHLARTGAILNAGTGSPNVFLQTSRYTGPPTPPTLSPTRPPTYKPVVLMVGTHSALFEKASFGAATKEELVYGRLAIPTDDLTLCTGTTTDLSGKAVLVTRGDCDFYTKAKIAQKKGAVMVIITQNSNDPPVIPGIPAGQINDITVQVMMISMADGNAFRSLVPEYARFGSESFTLPPSLSGPTNSPTLNPTSVPPTKIPTRAPTIRPTKNPTHKPTIRPTKPPPTVRPTKAPTMRPTKRPTNAPTMRPTKSPTLRPTKRPTKAPTMRPTKVA